MKTKAMFLIFFPCAVLGGCGSLPASPDGAELGRPPAQTGLISAELGREVALQAMGALGSRYAPGGTSPASGFDCSGLVGYAFLRATRRALPRTTYDLSRAGVRIDPRDLRPGDLVFFNTQRRPYSHVGIYVGEQRFIHAPSAGGAVRIDDMRGRYWLRRFNGARRVAL